ncbi:diguanylate cyclase domain-containing protein [Cellulomonas endophytica]|uniref:diguanylate cyclase domain-containing protein n=1 Tax=Cellulomonas endophytica TaxID=2494735 RepID=UPI001011C6A8|nr:diguanylate cyclase [Cellulomonas endophytica]
MDLLDPAAAAGAAHDDDPDAPLRAVVRVAAAVAGAPTATVNLFDHAGGRQCQPFTHGFVGADSPLDESMCVVTAHGVGAVSVPDASLDERWSTNPWVDGRRARVRRYASFPLHGVDGQVVGTLCVFDERPGDLDGACRAALADLATTTAALLRHRERAAHWRRAAQEADERRALLEGVLDSVEVGIVAADREGRVTLFNRTARRWHGVEADGTVAPGALAGHYGLFAEDGTTPLPEDGVPLLRALREGHVERAALVLAHPDGRRRTVETTGRALRGPEGTPRGAVVAMTDVTEQRRAAARDARTIGRQRALVRAQTRVAEADLVPAVVMDRICRGAQDVTGGTGALLVERRGAELLVQAATGTLDGLRSATLEPLRSLAGLALLSDTTARAGAGGLDPRDLVETTATGAPAMLAVPLHHRGDVIGAALVAGAGPEDLDRDDAGALRLLAAPFSAALAHAWAMEQAVREAATDALTGLPNRSAAILGLEHALARQDRHGGHVALLFLDLNGFKRVNDAQGHGAGDALLVQVAERIRRAVRAVDTPARYGGDEFVVVAEGLARPEDGHVLAARLREAVTGWYDLPGGPPARVGTAVGVALAHPEEAPRPLVERATALLVAADAAMYADKSGARVRAAR